MLSTEDLTVHGDSPDRNPAALFQQETCQFLVLKLFLFFLTGLFDYFFPSIILSLKTSD